MNKYGLIGKDLSYSYSKTIHEYLINHFKLAATYDLIETNEINKALLQQYEGLNITIPFKKAVINYLDEFKNNFASCNTILNQGQLIGYNTDIIGFAYLVQQLNLDNLNKIVILGNSASSQMIKEYFKTSEVIIISRSADYYNYELLVTLKADLLINTTPVGMNEFKSPIKAEYLNNYRGVIDLNYNPLNSLLALDCHRLNIPFVNGLLMLIKQACASFEIWHQLKVNDDLIKEIQLTIFLKHYPKIAIIGMPLTGKTTIVNQYNGIDLDEYIVKKTNSSISSLLSDGCFREYEHVYLKELVNNNTSLIALGGGAILDDNNIALLHDYLIIYYYEDLKVLKERLVNNYRPLLKDFFSLELLYQERLPLYQRYANIVLNYGELLDFLDKTLT